MIVELIKLLVNEKFRVFEKLLRLKIYLAGNIWLDIISAQSFKILVSIWLRVDIIIDIV